MGRFAPPGLDTFAGMTRLGQLTAAWWPVAMVAEVLVHHGHMFD